MHVFCIHPEAPVYIFKKKFFRCIEGVREEHEEGHGSLLVYKSIHNTQNKDQCCEQINTANSWISHMLFINENSSCAPQNSTSALVSSILIF